DRAVAFTSRWAISYLRGPLTHSQISGLMADQATDATTTTPQPGSQELAVGPDESTVVPLTAGGVAVRWIDQAAPWLGQVGATASGPRLAAGLVVTVDLLYDDARADLRHSETYEAVLFPLPAAGTAISLQPVDHDPRDLRERPPEQARYVLPQAPI